MTKLILPDRIFITGKQYSGKTTVANALADEYGYVHINFADEVKAELAAYHGITVESIEANKADWRKSLQRWGTDVRRSQDPEYWTKAWERVALRHPRTVVSDMRFANEAMLGLRLGGLLIKVQTVDEIRWQRAMQKFGRIPTEEEQQHPSETGIDYLWTHLTMPGDLPLVDIVATVRMKYYFHLIDTVDYAERILSKV